MRAPRWIFLGLLLALVAAIAALAAGDDAEQDDARPATQGAPRAGEPEDAAPADAAAAGGPEVVIVRRRGGVPSAWHARLARVAGVAAVTRVSRGQAFLRAARAARGEPAARRVPAGHVVLLDTLAIEPEGYARMLPAAQRAAFRRLRPGSALLSRTSARVRRAGPGATLTLRGGRRLRVAGVVDDRLVRAAELIVHRADGARLGTDRPYLLAAAPAAAPRELRAALGRPSGRRTVVARLGTAPWAVTGGIARPARLKARFGEFAIREPVGEDWIRLDPGFTERNIVRRRVPILGTVTCHRAMLPALRRALGSLARRGLARLVDREDYAGCYAPRRIPGSGSPSLHAWGLAIDLNAAANPYGARPRQDRRLVRAFERAGFTWGGRWPTAPDGMHFEYHGEGEPGSRPAS